jgi:hypothetical protein
MRFSGVVVSLALALSFASAYAAEPTVEPRFIETMMEDWRMNEDTSELIAIAADDKQENIGLLFRKDDTFRVYMNNRLILTQKAAGVKDPQLFVMADGHLVYHLNPLDLYVDGERVSSTSNTFKYSEGVRLEHMYTRGKIVFPDGNTIRSHDLRTNRSKILYRHSGDIAASRVHGTRTYYTVKDIAPLPGYYVFRDGKKLYYDSVDQPKRFEISPEGDVYFFHKGKETCQLFKNGELYAADEGTCAFIYTDENNNVWSVIGKRSSVATGFSMRLYKNGKRARTPAFYYIESNMSFKGAMYGARVLTSSKDLSDVRILKNGRLIGDVMNAGSLTDAFGVQFGPRSKTYARTMLNGKWVITEDGKPILTNTFRNALYLHASPEKVVVIGTRPTQKAR